MEGGIISDLCKIPSTPNHFSPLQQPPVSEARCSLYLLPAHIKTRLVLGPFGVNTGFYLDHPSCQHLGAVDTTFSDLHQVRASPIGRVADDDARAGAHCCVSRARIRTRGPGGPGGDPAGARLVVTITRF